MESYVKPTIVTITEEQILKQHIRSEDEVSAILKEIRVEAVS